MTNVKVPECFRYFIVINTCLILLTLSCFERAILFSKRINQQIVKHYIKHQHAQHIYHAIARLFQYILKSKLVQILWQYAH